MRVQPLPENEAPWYLRWLFRIIKKRYGHVLAPLAVWAHTPSVLFGFLTMGKALERKSSPIPFELRALIYTKVAQQRH